MKNKGFTIIESLVAIAILIVVITGTLSAIQTSLSSYIFSKDQVIAFYLAQEGFEQIRNIRDENGLQSLPWLTGLGPCLGGNACRVDAVADTLTGCGAPGSCPVLRQDATSGFFGYTPAWSATIFRREIMLTQINADDISVVVTVDWSKGIVNRQFRARENLLNWQ